MDYYFKYFFHTKIYTHLWWNKSTEEAKIKRVKPVKDNFLSSVFILQYDLRSGCSCGFVFSNVYISHEMRIFYYFSRFPCYLNPLSDHMFGLASCNIILLGI